MNGGGSRGTTLWQQNDLASGAGQNCALNAKGYFEQRPHRVDPPWFYAGPYVPSGVIYGRGLPSHSHWLVPGYDIDSHQIDLYAAEPSRRERLSYWLPV